MNILLDTNILVRLAEPSEPDHPLCLQAVRRLEQAGDGLHLCAQTAIEFWVVATRPKNVRGLGFDPVRTETALLRAERSWRWLPEPPDIAARWRRIVNRHAVLGKEAHDARLVALMEAHGLTHILTLNTTDFLRYGAITVLHPRDVT
jgi:predicted nucleic acid-binding protein